MFLPSEKNLNLNNNIKKLLRIFFIFVGEIIGESLTFFVMLSRGTQQLPSGSVFGLDA